MLRAPALPCPELGMPAHWKCRVQVIISRHERVQRTLNFKLLDSVQARRHPFTLPDGSVLPSKCNW